MIIGVNVLEEGLENTKTFVAAQGEGMSYRVAYSGVQGNKFELDWLEASQAQGIPQAFVIKDGKIIYKGHPGGLNEQGIEEMLSEDFDAEEYAKRQKAEHEALVAFSEKLRPLFQAQDWVNIKKLVMNDAYIKGKPDGAGLISQANQELGDWDAHIKK